MLFAASHVKNDLPWEVNSFAADNPGIEVRFGRDLGINPKLLTAAADRIAAALPKNGADPSDSLLIVVGRGTNDPDANSNIAKVARMLWEGMGFGWAETAFSGVAHPRVDTALSHSARLGFRRIVVFPYFLFTGILVKRIYDQSDTVARLFPDIEIVNAPYLRDHPAVLDAFCEQVESLGEGSPAMNCQLCKYRTQIIGYEADAGAPQAGHHHHVRGVGLGGGQAEPHDHPGHDHTITTITSRQVMFDTFIMVDWSAANVPRTGRDSIWMCRRDIEGETLVNAPTRHAAQELIGQWLAAASGRRVLARLRFSIRLPGRVCCPARAVRSAVARGMGRIRGPDRGR